MRGWLEVALGLLLYRRLGRIISDLERLAARFAAGRVRFVSGRARGAGVADPVARAAVGERIWPRDFGWLVKAASWQAAGYTSQLRAVLETPEMVALLEACPQAGRVLRPLCRALAIEMSVLRPRAARADGERGARVRRPRVAVDVGRVPIPRGVMSAVRRGRYGVV